ncbi:MAG TPA: hypothetical protein VMU32_08175 [Solirubrobacteraceae bacterium]|nr:hypothetical protein [Solirubrobacteraceae bacterium]
MRRPAPFRLSIALGIVLLALLGGAPAASAGGTTTKILEACSEGRIPRGYSQRDYREALKQMPAELAEYTSCPNLIHKAQLAGAAGSDGGPGGGSGGGPGGGAVAPPTQSEQHSLESSGHRGGSPVEVGGETLHPGVVHVDIASALGSLPTPLIALLAFLLAGAALMLGLAARHRLRALRLRRVGRSG